MNLPGVYPIFLDKWKNYQTCWVYADPHFGDKELAKGIPNRPSDEEQIKLINSKVGRKDVLIILGDCGDPAMCARLRGYKVLVMGNHDAGRSNYERKIFTHKFPKDDYTESSALDEMKRMFPNCQCSVEEHYSCYKPFVYWCGTADNHVFDEVYEGPIMLGEKLILSHEPLDIDWAFNIHGHNHSSLVLKDATHLNVCSDVIEYTPVNLNQSLKNGLTSKVHSIHRTTIDKARRKAIWRQV